MEIDFLKISRNKGRYTVELPLFVCEKHGGNISAHHFDCEKCSLNLWCVVSGSSDNPFQIFKGNHFLLLITEDVLE